MNDSIDIALFAIALHLERDPDTISLNDRLAEDLGMDPLDLVLVALRIEEWASGEFPVGDLESAVTVGDLVDVVACWSSPPTTRSGLMPAVRHDVRSHAASGER